MSEPKLKRNLSFISMIAIASGAVIGGWLAEAPTWFGLTGAGAAGEQGGTCNSSSGQTGDLHKVTAGKIHNETLLVIA